MKKKSGEKIALQVRFPVEIHNQLMENANKAKRSLNSEVLICVEKYIENRKEEKAE